MPQKNVKAKPPSSTTPLTIGALSDAIARTGRSAPTSTLRNLERRGIIKAQRNSARTRLFDVEAAYQVIAYLDQRDAARV